MKHKTKEALVWWNTLSLGKKKMLAFRYFAMVKFTPENISHNRINRMHNAEQRNGEQTND